MKSMIKHTLSIVIAAVLIFSALPISAAETASLLQNGDFSEIAENGIPAGWELPVGQIGKNVKIVRDDKTGDNAICFYGEKTSCYLAQKTDIPQKENYTLLVDVKRVDEAGGELRVEFFDENDARMDGKAAVYSLAETKAGKWENVSFTFAPPGKASKMQVMLRLSGGGEYCFDNVSLMDAASVMPQNPGGLQEDGTWIPKTIQNSKNLIPNGDLEEVAEDGTLPTGWRTQYYPTMVTLNSDPAYCYSGEHSFRISCQDTTLPWARYEVTEGIVPGAECTFSAWVYSPTKATSIAFKTEYYVQNYDYVVGTGSGGGTVKNELTEAEGWTKISWTERIPDKSEVLWFYIRLYGTGEVYYDDITYELTKGPDAFTSFMVDNCFYYSDWEGTGNVTASVNTSFYPEFIGCPVKFSVLDGIKTVYEGTVPVPENGDAFFAYPLTLFEKDFKEYIVRGELFDMDGHLITKGEDTVYRVPRPGYITKEGYYMENGKYFDPVYTYHADLPSLDALPDFGINLIQGYPSDTWIKKCEELGLKQIVVLYSGGGSGQSAGHPDRIKQTIASVKALKDSPSTFAYALMDEPTSTAWSDLKRAYLEIRKIDPNHPVFITMNHNFDTSGRFTDIVSMDSYPYGFSPFTVSDYDTMTGAQTKLGERKPMYDLLQAFDYKNSYPTANEIRNMIYQAYWSGAKGIGFFSWDDPVTDENGNLVKLPASRLGEPIRTFLKTEHREVVDHFVYHKYPTFTEVRKDRYWYRAWVKNDGTVSVVVLNRNEKEETEAEIRLTSADGSVTLGDMDIRVINGDDAEPFKGTNGSFRVTLEPGQAILYSVKTDAELSEITSSRFLDMYTHAWADKAVKALDEAGLIYSTGFNTYRPADNITRADFAYMLIRALDIPMAAEGELFADADALAYYAPALRAGRAAGVLQGVGEDRFGTESEITRQDMMVMCIRALETLQKLSGVKKADISVFTDRNMISDYAEDAVQKMVGAGLVIGNADATVNPKGTTTRAEAAVLIQRLREMA